jgi:hypothetical protein
MVSIPDLALTRQVHVVDTPGADSLSELQLIAMRNIPLSDCYIVFDTTSSVSVRSFRIRPFFSCCCWICLLRLTPRIDAS